MNATSFDIKDILDAETGLGLIFATSLFIGKEPPQPDNCVTIFDTPGYSPQLTLKQGENHYYPSIQVLVRNKDYATGWDLINEIKTLLHGKGPETINGTLYSVISCAGEPALLDWDDHNRCRFVANFNLQRNG